MSAKRRIATLAVGVLAATIPGTAAMTIVGAAPALAETTTFATPGEHEYTVPAGVTRIRVIAMGANGLFAGFGFGVGAVAQADIPVTPGSTLYAVVGGNGGQSAAGFNGGGGTFHAGGGGGGTDLRTCTIEPDQPNTCEPADLGTAADPRLIVAGGGGGTGRIAFTNQGSNVGSPGGAPNAGPGGDGVGPERGFGGQGGSQTGGGAGGAGPLPGENGTAGQGGMGGSSSVGGDGGGGGGGYFGGGGGGGTQAEGSGGGGGAGGSSYVVDGATEVSYRQKTPSEASSISIISPIPQAVTFTSTPPNPAVYGGTYQATATGGSSGQPVVFSADASSTPGACSVSAGGEVAFTGVGTCVVNADQAGDNNYEAAARAQQSISITPAPLVVTAPSPTRAYGAANPDLTPSYSGFVNGDNEADLTTPATCSTTATPASGVGTYPVTCSGATSPNYTFSYVDGTLTITPASLVVTAPSPSRVYGAANPALTPGYSGFVNGDDEADLTTPAVCTTTATAASGVGTYPVTCSGATSSNYTFSYVDGTLTITPASLVVTAPSPSRVYGTDNPALIPSYSGFVNGDDDADLTTPATCSTTATAASGVGTYPVTCTGATSANYAISYVDGTLTITPAPLVVTAPSPTRAYGADNPDLTPTYSGFVNGDDEADLTTPATCSTTATPASGVGTYPVTCTGATSANYTFTYVDGTLTITPAALVVTAPSPTRVYGADNPALIPSYSGFVNGDDEADLTTPATCSTTATPASGVGTYPVTCAGASSSNYTFSYADGTLTITPAPLVVTAPSPTRVYGADNPALTPTYSGFVNGDDEADLTTPATCTTTATPASGVGTYPVTCAGATSSNYTFSYVDGTLTITPASLVVTAPSPTRVYGADNPALTPSYSGFVNGDDEADLTTPATCTTTATPASDVGTYPVVCTGATSPNYAITYVDGTLTITQAPTTLTAASLLSTLFFPTATLVRSDTGAPIAGQPIAFSVGGNEVCRATTNASGVARCSAIVISLSGFDAFFEGSLNYSESNIAHGNLL